MTEAASCKDEDVFIVGGANSAGQAAMYFANYARRVVMLVRAPRLPPECRNISLSNSADGRTFTWS